LVIDIFKAEQAYELVKIIGLNSDEIKRGKFHNYDELFGTIQLALQTESLLATARIYDTPSNKYPTRCLRGLIKYLSDKADELPTIRDPYHLIQHLKYMGVEEKILGVTSDNPDKFARSFSGYVERVLENPETADSLDKLKLFRDKSIAHNEKRDAKIIGPTWSGLKDLIGLAKNVVGVLGWAYFSTAYVIDGEYILSSDASRTSNALKKLFSSILKN